MYMESLLKVLPILHLEEVSATDLFCNYLNANLIQKHDVADTVVGRSVGNVYDIFGGSGISAWTYKTRKRWRKLCICNGFPENLLYLKLFLPVL